MLPFFYFQSSCAHFNDTFLASVKVKRYLDPIKGALIVGSLKVLPSFCDKYKFCDTTWGVGWSDMIRFEDIDHLNTSNCSPFYNILWAPLWVAHSFLSHISQRTATDETVRPKLCNEISVQCETSPLLKHKVHTECDTALDWWIIN